MDGIEQIINLPQNRSGLAARVALKGYTTLIVGTMGAVLIAWLALLWSLGVWVIHLLFG